MGLPELLKIAIEKKLATVNSQKITVFAKRLSDKYRYLQRDGSSFMSSEEDYLAYLATRFPATYGAISKVLSQIQDTPLLLKNLLDVGAGPGTAFWAAREFFPLQKVTLLEKETGLVQLGKSLTALQKIPCDWRQGEMEKAIFEPHDLIVMAYSLGEIDIHNRFSLLERLWKATSKVIVLIEPGTPVGYQTILEARKAFISMGAHLFAPCPHHHPCPLSGSDWCHFSARIERSSCHRKAKGGALNYEDEKFSYLVCTREPLRKPGSRVIRHPQKGTGHVGFTLCSPEGIESKVISRKQKEFYRTSKKMEWGSLLNLNTPEL